MNSNEIFQNAVDILARREFNLTYVILDSVFVLFLVVLLFFKKKYITLLWSLFGGVLYLLVDYGLFYLAAKSRFIFVSTGGEWELLSSSGTFLVLLWMSLSYGITNFAFIWLALKKDKHFKHFTFLIFGWWICAPQLSQMGGNGYLIRTARTTNSYHWIMALILVVGYAIFITYQLFRKEENKKWFYDLGRLNLIGIAIQFAWEFALLLGGIRPWVGAVSIQTLLINSFIETNLGMPIIFFIFTLVTNKWNDDLTKVQKQS